MCGGGGACGNGSPGDPAAAPTAGAAACRQVAVWDSRRGLNAPARDALLHRQRLRHSDMKAGHLWG